MCTRRNQSVVSSAFQLLGRGLAAAVVFSLWIGACAARRYPITTTGEPTTDVLQFDNQAPVYVDVYLVGGQMQWRLGRVPPGMRATLIVPPEAIGWAVEFLRVAVIPGSRISAEAWRDPAAIIAIAQPLSETLSQRWTFRQSDRGGAPPQLLATQLPRPR